MCEEGRRGESPRRQRERRDRRRWRRERASGGRRGRRLYGEPAGRPENRGRRERRAEGATRRGGPPLRERFFRRSGRGGSEPRAAAEVATCEEGWREISPACLEFTADLRNSESRAELRARNAAVKSSAFRRMLHAPLCLPEKGILQITARLSLSCPSRPGTAHALAGREVAGREDFSPHGEGRRNVPGARESRGKERDGR